LRQVIEELEARYPCKHPNDIELVDVYRKGLALLASDLAEQPIDLVERAARHWAQQSVYMPKAADLIRLIGNFRQQAVTHAGTNEEWMRAKCDESNRRAEVAGSHCRWVIRRGYIVPIDVNEYRRDAA
jgi:hypothetical protein